MSGPWLTVIGIGDDGLEGLAPRVRRIVEQAEVLVGGERHQAMVPETQAERLTWEGGVHRAAEHIARCRGRRVVVLATGDPMWFGGGANLARHFSAEEMRVIPHPGAFSLAAARMLWPIADVETITVHGRPLDSLALYLQPGARLLVLSRDGDTPQAAAALLTARGWGPSLLTVLEHLGGPRERRIDGTAADWAAPRCADLNVLAIECRPADGTAALSRVPGLPDAAFGGDGQLTKREIRALTVSALSPLSGQVLWDVGAGSGSVAIEWLRSVPCARVVGHGGEARAFAIERRAERCAAICENAATLGVPQLNVVHGAAPEILAELPPPDSVFVGGGVTLVGLLETCWDALPAGGRLVANGVSLEAMERLHSFRATSGGTLTRLSVSHAEPLGGFSAFRPALDVVQYVGVKETGE